jgi:hypothetical protein
MSEAPKVAYGNYSEAFRALHVALKSVGAKLDALSAKFPVPDIYKSGDWTPEEGKRFMLYAYEISAVVTEPGTILLKDGDNTIKTYTVAAGNFSVNRVLLGGYLSEVADNVLSCVVGTATADISVNFEGTEVELPEDQEEEE